MRSGSNGAWGVAEVHRQTPMPKVAESPLGARQLVVQLEWCVRWDGAVMTKSAVTNAAGAPRKCHMRGIVATVEFSCPLTPSCCFVRIQVVCCWPSLLFVLRTPTYPECPFFWVCWLQCCTRAAEAPFARAHRAAARLHVACRPRQPTAHTCSDCGQRDHCGVGFAPGSAVLARARA